MMHGNTLCADYRSRGAGQTRKPNLGMTSGTSPAIMSCSALNGEPQTRSQRYLVRLLPIAIIRQSYMY